VADGEQMTKHQLEVQRDVFKVLAVSMLVALAFAWVKRSMDVSAEMVHPQPYSVIVVEKEVPVEVVRLPDEVEEFVRAVFGKEADNALKVFRCESGLRAQAYNKNTNGSIDVGVAQINSVHGVPKRYLENYKINILVAKQIYDASGWNPWVCAKKVGII
jgi:hypothetical protein